jgi:alpha-D-xyloside xylohydrolase
MKFHRGAWLTEQGVTLTPARRLYRQNVDAANGVLNVCTLDRHGGRGDGFEGTSLQLQISSPMENVVRVRATHHVPRDRPGTRFPLDYSLRAENVRIEQHADSVAFASGDLQVRMGKANGWWMRFEHAGKTLVDASGLSLAQIVGQESRLVQRLSLDVGETLYGFGERFGPLAKNGQSVVIWNEDPGTNSEWCYKNIPFYLSSSGYGLLVNSPARVEFEVGTERVNQVQFSVPGDELDYYLFLGPDPKAVLDRYTRLSGRPPVPPPWSNGLWLSTSFTTKYDEKTVTEFVDGMASRDIPLSVFHFDCFWMKERHWCDFEWNAEGFPDPAGMLKRLRARGLKICLWINPYISGLSKLFEEGASGGYFLKRSDGRVFQRDQWQPAMAIVDFTNPAAVAWFQDKLKQLIDIGVDCFKTDFGERIPDEGVAWHDGADPKAMHNLYAHLYNKAVYDVLVRERGEADAIVFARAATAGCQQFPVHWGGDCEATFASMAEDLRGGLSFCMSGPAYWSHDIGGFSGKADPAVFKRWLQFGLLSTHSRLHGNESYRVPWLFDEESVDVARRFARLKNRLFPYLYAAAHDARDQGWPVMRSMFVEFPNDPACRYLDRQYLLGASLLVAPIFNHAGRSEYYLPAGPWTHLLNNERVNGGQWRSENYGFDSLPVFQRGGSILPLADSATKPAWALRTDPLTLRVTPSPGEMQQRLVGSDGAEARVYARCEGRSVELSLEGKIGGRVRVMLAGVGELSGIRNGRAGADDELGQTVEWLDTARPLTLSTP